MSSTSRSATGILDRQNQSLQAPVNPNAKRARGMSQGFQRIELTREPATQRDFVRVSANSTNPLQTYEPIHRPGLGQFRPDAVTCCLEMAIVNRTSAAPVLVQLRAHQQNSVILNPQGAGDSFVVDNVLGAVTPNTANMYRPTPESSGAQLLLANILGQPLTIGITDLSGAPITDLQQYYVSLVLFERVF